VRQGLWSKAALLVAMAMLAMGLAGPAHASTPVPATPTVDANLLAFAMYPADKQLGDYFIPTIKAGKSATLHVNLTNTGNVAFNARTLAINAGTAVNGGFHVADPGTKPEGVTTWLDYPEATYPLEPGKGIQAPLVINVPKGTAPGQYITALVMETADARTVSGGSFKQVIRQALPVFITVPGAISAKFDVSDIVLTKLDSAIELTFGVNNSGNILVKPQGTVAVVDAQGATVLTAPVLMNSVYARDKTTLTVGLPALVSGTYTVNVDLHDEATGATASIANASVTFNSDATPVPPPPISIATATAAPHPSLKKIQFLQVDAKITNTGAPIANARLTLHVTRNDKVVEDYSLSSSLALPTGDTAIQSRYIPAAGWKSGTWAFTLTLETVDPATGVNVVVGSTDLGGPIVVP